MDKIYAYKQGSASALALARGLGIKVIKHEGSKFRGGALKKVINWGCSQLPVDVLQCDVINQPIAVALAANKLTTFKKFQENNNMAVEYGFAPDINFPPFTEDVNDVQGWLANANTVVARHKLTGHSGEGIELLSGDVVIPEAPLYVRYIKKSQEYRVHVMGEYVVDVQRKARSKDVQDEDVNWQVRNHTNGFIYAREGFETPESVKVQAILAVEALGLDFGAVDIIWNDREQKPYVLEVNCAPGLTGQTLQGYIDRFKEL
jgi:hypothetical protein